MTRWRTRAFVLGAGVVVASGATQSCASTAHSGFPEIGDGGEGASSSGNSTGSNGGSNGAVSSGGFASNSSSSSSSGAMANDGSVACPPGLECDVSCPGGTTTTVSGTVYDPAGRNPLYNIAVYVPATPLQTLAKGVPTGPDACSCAALYKSGSVTSTTTDVKGHFTLPNVPVGSSVPLVLQVGKWRHTVNVSVSPCRDNPQPDKSLALNATVAAGTTDTLPDIAVSTGHSDTLECLMSRIGLPSSEFVAGTSTLGHVHIFAGGDPGLRGTAGGPEQNGMPNAPQSSKFLWDTANDLMLYDILLLSCEGQETYAANPPALESYLNAGGRAFASHFHYAWFSNNINPASGYTTTPDWGGNLATWTPGSGGTVNPSDGVVVQTLNVGGGTFPKGQAMDQWLTDLGALGTIGVPAGDLAIYEGKNNASVAPANLPSQPWITAQVNGTKETEYFSFDTPVTAKASDDGGPPSYCGRAVFSDLHVDGNPTYASAMDTPNKTPGMAPPQGCAAGPLSPQEMVLEFMLFDLSSCVVSDNVVPAKMIPVY
jgi:hypothetical protein